VPLVRRERWPVGHGSQDGVRDGRASGLEDGEGVDQVVEAFVRLGPSKAQHEPPTGCRGQQPDPARAASLGLDALAAARQTGSARILGELRTLDQRLTARWPGHPASRSIRDALAA
jgi:hypothetical protein